MRKSVINSDKNKYRVVMVKTVDNMEPVFYRVVNLSTYTTEDIPAYRILDEIVTKKKNIINIKSLNNKVYIVDDDGYESMDQVIVVDVLDKEVQDLHDWALSNGDIGSEIISRYDSKKNHYSLSNTRIDSTKKLGFTCDNGHTLFCEFSTYFSTGCSCPMCEAANDNKVLSLRYWCRLTHNFDILNYYDEAGELNDKDSRNIPWNSRKEVSFKYNDEVITARLDEVTSGNKKLAFKDLVVINLSKKKKAQGGKSGASAKESKDVVKTTPKKKVSSKSKKKDIVN